jgi:hypothetical protein
MSSIPETLKNTVLNYWRDPEATGSFSGLYGLQTGLLLDKNISVPISQLRQIMRSQSAYLMHVQKRLRFPRRGYQDIYGFLSILAIDIAYMNPVLKSEVDSKLTEAAAASIVTKSNAKTDSKENSKTVSKGRNKKSTGNQKKNDSKEDEKAERYQYILAAQDVWSRRIWAYGLTDKSGASVRSALELLFASVDGQIPRTIECDKGLLPDYSCQTLLDQHKMAQ